MSRQELTTVPGVRRIAVLLATAMVAGACGGDEPADRTASITVFAASSLTDAFTEIGAAYEAAHPGSTITFSFGSSSALATQLVEGAPADVFAAADERTMARVVDERGVHDSPIVFARNELAIVVEPGNPLGIAGLADLARADVTVALCAETVPCGNYAQQALRQAGVRVEPASFESSVKGVVSKVALGEVDAGIAYATDVPAAEGTVDGVDIPSADNVDAAFPIVTLVSDDAAVGFREFVVRPDLGRPILERHGFLPP
jgi:molybdate transport system substrate-binding protein